MKAATPAYVGWVPPGEVDVEAFHHVGDPLAEALVIALREHRTTPDLIAGARQLEAAGHPAAVEFFKDVEHVPDWADFEAMRAGAAIGRRYPEGLLVGIYGALPLTYVDPGVACVMKSTGRLTRWGDGFERRFWETATGFVGALDVDGMKPGGDRWEQWVRIRFLHTMIRLGILRKGGWELAAGMPISQAQTAAGAHLFGRYRVNVIRAFGGLVTDDEGVSFELMWRWIARLQGANSELLGVTSEEQFRIQQRILGHLYGPDDESREVSATMLDGLARMRAFRVRLPRRVHSAFARRILASELVEIAAGRDVPGDLGIPADPLAEVLVRAGVAGLRATNQLTRLSSVQRYADRHGQQMRDRMVERGLQHRVADYRPTS